jgi:pilus assembly protein Flp/PilA
MQIAWFFILEGLSMNIMSRFLQDESGATAIEYGLIAALVAVAIITALTTLGTKLTGTFTNVSGKL